MITLRAGRGDRREPVTFFDESSPSLSAGDYPRYSYATDDPERLGAHPVARDLVRIAVAVHLADRYVRRSLRSGTRSRRLSLAISVEDRDCWEAQRELIEELAEFASADEWTLSFRRAKKPRAAGGERNAAEPPAVVALLSGGLDSLCGAAYLASRGERAAFVTHSPPGRERTRELLSRTFEAFRAQPPLPEHVVSYAVLPRQQNRAGERVFFQEPTRRTRPFFFLALACATAIALGARRVQLSENGGLGLSLPVRRSHYGARMTRQAHSFLMDGFRRLLDGVAPGKTPWSVENPFSLKTKGEACAELGPVKRFAAETLSCEYGGQQIARLRAWETSPAQRRKRDRYPVLQCGLCIPCLVRRAGLHGAGIRDDDAAYFFDARKTLRALRAGRDPYGGKPPPLYEFVNAHCFYLARFAEELKTMTVADFAVQYLPELRAVRPRIAEADTMGSLHELEQRFAREVLDYLT